VSAVVGESCSWVSCGALVCGVLICRGGVFLVGLGWLGVVA
jgi:hypothetical protein